MICPNCQATPMGFVPFLLFGWYRIVCRNCRAELSLKSVGERFWSFLAAGTVASGAIWFFVDYPYRILGERGTLALFVTVIASTLLSAFYCAWKDSRFDHSAGS